LDQIKKRGRAYEQDIQPEYLDKINTGYLEYIKAQKDLNVMVIDVTDKDFVNSQDDYVWLLDAISSRVNA
jgi:deoxyguanosine kinase